ncbi:nuclear transport factor 2 family protein [Streptomyces sp. NPDC008121]|uniref:nuclear transport factor 2 family protein n=1 Tax=Streptomyces sp. NPDC008121 TaxID=3364809 RepID=UPI0036EE5DBD
MDTDTTSTTDDTASPTGAASLADSAAVTRLFDRYLRSLDDRGPYDAAWAADFFTEDATTSTPAGDVRGREAIAANIRMAMGLFERTVHFGSNYLVDVEGDRATLVGNQLSTHVRAGSGKLFVSGGRTENALVRTPRGWRLSRADLRVVWTQGDRPVIPGAGAAPH